MSVMTEIITDGHTLHYCIISMLRLIRCTIQLQQDFQVTKIRLHSNQSQPRNRKYKV